MFRLLHTSDWHLGRKLAGYDRSAEFEAFFDFLERIIADKKPDLMLISGDVFDTGSPANEVVRRYCSLLVNLHLLFPDLQVVITCGNHDSPSFLNIHAEVFKFFSAKVTGCVEYQDTEIDWQKMVSEIMVDNQPAAIVCSVPYLRSGDLRRLDVNANIKDFYTKLYEFADQLRGNRDIPIIATGHFTATGVTASDGQPIVGKLEGVNTDGFPPFDYIGLGHIHRAQQCGNRQNIRYSGSPLPFVFAEKTQPKSICIVDFEGSKLTGIELEEIPQFVGLKILPTEPGDIYEVEKACREFPADKDAFVEINIKNEFRTPENRNRIITDFLADKNARFCGWHVQKTKPLDAQPTDNVQYSAQQFKNTDPLDVIAQLYLQKTSNNLDTKYLRMLKEIIDAPL
ncbi:MAG: exonuclease subunit SbcD [Bacteroidales bacterium]|nr:exonuclease subunit SbcD [Bacteroidales bacterium]